MKKYLMVTTIGILVAAGLLFAGYIGHMTVKLVSEAVEIMVETTRWAQDIIATH